MEKIDPKADAKQKTQKHEKKPQERKPAESKPVIDDKGFRQLVRVSGVVLDGNKEIHRVLPIIKGLGYSTTRTMLAKMNVPKDKKLGSLTEAEVENLENNIRDINKTVPVWMTNRRKDIDTGADLHLIGSELDIANREDITRQKKIKSYRGIRHILGQPVRGQRTRTSFRTGTAVGVSRKKAVEAAAAAAKAAPKTDKK